MLKGVFGSVEHQQEEIYGLGYKLNLTRNKNEFFLDKAAGIFDARIKNDHTQWYVGQYTPSIPQQSILTKRTLTTITTKLRYIE